MLSSERSLGGEMGSGEELNVGGVEEDSYVSDIPKLTLLSNLPFLQLILLISILVDTSDHSRILGLLSQSALSIPPS